MAYKQIINICIRIIIIIINEDIKPFYNETYKKK